MMLITIFKYEIKQLLRSKGMIATVFIFSAIGIFALLQGKSVYDFQQTSIEKTLQSAAKNESRVKSIFDTLQNKGKRTDSDIGAPYVLEWNLKAVQAKNISPLAVLSTGQNDIYTPLLSAHFNDPYFNNQYAEFKNPEELFAGNLDSSFFILFILPLLLLSFTYDIQSAEKENAVTPLLKVQATTSLTAITNMRLLFRWLVALLPLLVVCLLSYIVLSALPGFSAVSFLQWWTIGLLYTMFWLLIIAVIQRFQFSSLINAIILAGLWVLLLIAIPGLSNAWFSYKYPPVDKTVFSDYRDIDFKGYDIPFAEHEKMVFAQYPQWKNSIQLHDTNYFKSFSNTLQALSKEKQIHHASMKNSELLLQAEINNFWINPVGGVMRSFTTISQSTLANQQAFEEAIINVRERKARYLYENYLTKPHFTKSDFEGMPKVFPVVISQSPAKYLAPLALWSILSLVIVLLKSKQHHSL
ncbi:MAG: hypothetical protein KF746_06915 [Chitinophagaceae bacterium]|nr:hypothetical protein [Chitinophagaceae bacterium]